jgi:hypothetical protein
MGNQVFDARSGWGPLSVPRHTLVAFHPIEPTAPRRSSGRPTPAGVEAHRGKQYIMACLTPSPAGPRVRQSRQPVFANPFLTRASRTDRQQARTRMPHPTRSRERPLHAGLHELRLCRATQGQIHSKLWPLLALRRVAQVCLRPAPCRPSEIAPGQRQARPPPPTEPHRNG